MKLVRDAAAEENGYQALRSRAVVIDRSARGRVRIFGERAREMVSGLVSNDVSALTPGQGCYSAALTAKGKIVADVRVFADAEGVLTDTAARAGDAWLGMVKKFINPRLAKHADEHAALRTIGIFGPASHHVVSELTGVNAPVWADLPLYAHMTQQLSGASCIIARVPDAGVQGFDLFVSAAAYDHLWQAALKASATPVDDEVFAIARVEAGRPEWGVDMDDNTIPQEANFDELNGISYTKGCYVGQETVARVHFRGHVNKHLRGLTFEKCTDLPLLGATVHNVEGLQVGDVRSAVTSPRLGQIALAMIRREVEFGAKVHVRWSGEGQCDALVAELPFPDRIA